jgi:hypothetical protein
LTQYYRSYCYNGENKEAIAIADTTIEAESEFDYMEQDITRGDDEADFEWTSGVYTLREKVDAERAMVK